MLAAALVTVTIGIAAGLPGTAAAEDERLARALEQWAARANCALDVRVGVDLAHDKAARGDERVMNLSGQPSGARGEPFVGHVSARRLADGRLVAHGVGSSESAAGRTVGVLGGADGRAVLLARRAAGAQADVQMLARDLLSLLDPDRLRRAAARVDWVCLAVEGGDGVLYEGRFGPDLIGPERAHHVSVFGDEVGDLELRGVDAAFHIGADGLLRAAHFDVRRVREDTRLVPGAARGDARIEVVDSEATLVTYDLTFAEASTPAQEEFLRRALSALDPPAPAPCAPRAAAPRFGAQPPTAAELRAACAWLLPRSGAYTLALDLSRPANDPPRRRGGAFELASFAAFKGALLLRRGEDGRITIAGPDPLDGFALRWGPERVFEDRFVRLPPRVGNVESQLAFLAGPDEFERAVLAAEWTLARDGDGRACVRGELDGGLLRRDAPPGNPWDALLLELPGSTPAPIPASWVLDEAGVARELRLSIGGDGLQVATRAFPGTVVERPRRTLVVRPAAGVPWHLADFEERCRRTER